MHKKDRASSIGDHWMRSAYWGLQRNRLAARSTEACNPNSDKSEWWPDPRQHPRWASLSMERVVSVKRQKIGREIHVHVYRDASGLHLETLPLWIIFWLHICFPRQKQFPWYNYTPRLWWMDELLDFHRRERTKVWTKWCQLFPEDRRLISILPRKHVRSTSQRRSIGASIISLSCGQTTWINLRSTNSPWSQRHQVRNPKM